MLMEARQLKTSLHWVIKKDFFVARTCTFYILFDLIIVVITTELRLNYLSVKLSTYS